MVLVLSVIVLVGIEVFSWIAISVLDYTENWRNTSSQDRDARRNMAARSGVDYSALVDEMNRIYVERPRLHPYRWYTPEENFSGRYVTTDKWGFRADREAAISEVNKIGFFGGSTMFSTTTHQAGTIPAILNRKYLNGEKALAVNFGVGGYSSSAELITFIEVLRRTHLRYAVFYDGINEVGRYAEWIQDEPEGNFFNLMGYYLTSPYRQALRNEEPSFGQYEIQSIKLVRRVYQSLVLRGLIKSGSGARSVNMVINEGNVDEHAREIVDLYANNVLDIASIAARYGVVPIFFWQPDVYLTKKKLTEREQQIARRNPAVRLLAVKVRSLVRSDTRFRGLHLFDVSGALDNMTEQDHFFDYAHLSEQGNMVVAEAIAADLKTVTPKDYWLHMSASSERLVEKVTPQ